MAKEIVVYSPTGDRGVIPREQLKDALAQGYRLPTQAEYDQADLEKEYDKQPGWARAVGVVKHLGPVPYLAGEVIGAVADTPVKAPPELEAYKHGVMRSVGVGPVNVGALAQSAMGAYDPQYAETIRKEKSAFPLTSLGGEIAGGVGSALNGPSTGTALSGYAKSPLAQF